VVERLEHGRTVAAEDRQPQLRVAGRDAGGVPEPAARDREDRLARGRDDVRRDGGQRGRHDLRAGG
jgi:hypothetical protein